jgi:hypothetical protein
LHTDAHECAPVSAGTGPADFHRHAVRRCVSQAILDEASVGDPEEAKTRIGMIGDFPVLEITEEAESLAAAILASGAIPRDAVADALSLGGGSEYH